MTQTKVEQRNRLRGSGRIKGGLSLRAVERKAVEGRRTVH